MSEQKDIEKAYAIARERYAECGVDTDRAMGRLSKIAISIHCWQGDDVGGFEDAGGLRGGGIVATGAYPGKARTANELRADMSKAMSLIPGRHRLNLHAIYAETGGRRVERNELEPVHFDNWIDWAGSVCVGVDFNPTFFSHPKADSGFTLSSNDKEVRRFWIEHGIACRKIGEYIGKKLNSTCVTNIWIPDGSKDIPVDRKRPRMLLKDSLDEIFAEKINDAYNRDSLECKLFGIGSESFVVGSHEFYLGYAMANNKLVCLDAGHFHPTEVISDKISAVLAFLEEIMLHVSRPVRWDSDHVVILTDELLAIAQEIVRGDFLGRTHIGLDFFDASINRVAAWVIGTRATLKAILTALLEPTEKLRAMEVEGDYTSRLAVLEELKSMPAGAVWDYYCLSKDVPPGGKWLEEVQRYEIDVQSKRT